MRTNRYLQDFKSQLRSRFAEDSINMPMSVWIEKNTRLKKKPFSFKGYEFQRQICDDMHPTMSVIKCSQIGLTEIQLRKFLGFLARNTALSGIFSLPDDNMYKRVSATRVKPLIDNEPVFNLGGIDKPIRRMDLYQINQSFGYFVGNKESDATSINADFLFHDEVDLSDQEMLGLFQSRLQGSNFQITQGFSTPTFEGFGIDAGFKASDQHEYLWRCQRCNHHNIPLFTPEFIAIPGLPGDINDLSEIDPNSASSMDLGAGHIRCEKCGKALDPSDPSLRSWVPRYPGRTEHRGYRVSPFCVPRLTVRYIVKQLLQYKQKDALRRFYNTVLGEAYNDSNARLSDTDIRAVMHGSTKVGPSTWPVFIGIDVGITCHVVLMHLGGERPVIFDWRQVLADNLPDEIDTILKSYNVIGGAIDRHPYTPLANDIRERAGGRIVPVEYASSPTAPAVSVVNDELENLSHIRANRTTMIDSVVGAIRKRKTEFVGYKQFEPLILQHLKDMVRIEKEDQSAIWQKLTGNDHFFHALAQVFFAARVHDALLYRSDAEQRTSVGVSTIIVSMNNEAPLGTLLRQRTHMQLGSMH